MIFKDRCDAGHQLGELLKKELANIDNKNIVIVSLLRGGVPVGHEVAKMLHASHIPLVVAKISTPQNEELALGAVCFDITYLDREIIQYVGDISRKDISLYVKDAQFKFEDYMDRYMLHKTNYQATLKNKTVILVDDGIATGATIKAACLYITSCRPKKIYAAAPVILGSLQIPGVTLLSNKHDGATGSISQYYGSFPQLEDAEILKLLRFS